MSQLQLFPSDEESNFSPDPQPQSADPRTTPSLPNISTDPQASPRGRLPARTATRSPRRRGQPSPPPARHHNPSPASSYRSAVPTIPPIGKWTVLGLRQALINSDVQFSRRMNKAELYALYVSLQSTNLSPKSMPAPKRTSRQSKAQDSPRSTTPPSQRTKSSSLSASNRSRRPSASLGRAPVPSAVRPRQQAAALVETRPADLPSAYQNMAPAVSNNPFSFQWPPAPVPDASARLPPLALEAQSFQPTFTTATNPSSFQWPAAPVAQASMRLPPLAAQAHFSQFQPSFPSHTFNPLPQAPEANSSVRLPPPTIAAPASAPFSSLLQAKSLHSLFTATQMPVPSNAVAAEPPPVSHNIRAQILSEIQDAGSRGRPIPNSSTSLFRTNIPVTHPLKQLLDTSLDTILQAVSPRTLQSYVTAWRCFKAFHFSYTLPFPDFSLLSITSFISYLNSIKGLQVGTIKGYLSGIQFFHKLMYGAPSPEINNSQTSLLVKGIQRSHPTHPDTRQPITLDILTKCIHALRTVYQPLETARTLDAMFILAFFGFLRCSELAITSKFDPRVHPTISDLSVLDSETISYLIKQSKTDQSKKGHFIYIFKLSSPIQPYQSIQAYLHWRSSQAKSHLDPLFIDDSNKPVTRFWFQKHLKSVLQQSGIQAKHFSSHSFRIGAATSAAQKGLSQQQIQALGRWSSDAFQSYIRTNRFHIKKAHQTLIE
ncbi:proline-rich protein 36-like [Rhinichthys klamathensis goyatoka]|uniref:proline-rich protein 36-like n=1 Tax=Rhinichthys klamathensis goyatoka TaxID=3034132 RepID=UPI0024B48BA9|nr:proline-rich protein 36-like [Rhinichthys klamathensis goyatoka]